jgi:hypothetical protein
MSPFPGRLEFDSNEKLGKFLSLPYFHIWSRTQPRSSPQLVRRKIVGLMLPELRFKFKCRSAKIALKQCGNGTYKANAPGDHVTVDQCCIEAESADVTVVC